MFPKLLTFEMVIVFTPVQFANALEPNDVTLFGKSILVSDVQFRNAS